MKPHTEEGPIHFLVEHPRSAMTALQQTLDLGKDAAGKSLAAAPCSLLWMQFIRRFMEEYGREPDITKHLDRSRWEWWGWGNANADMKHSKANTQRDSPADAG